jgi:hypothetical protein
MLIGQFETFGVLRESSTIGARRAINIGCQGTIFPQVMLGRPLWKCRPAAIQNDSPAMAPATVNTGAIE